MEALEIPEVVYTITLLIGGVIVLIGVLSLLVRLSAGTPLNGSPAVIAAGIFIALGPHLITLMANFFLGLVSSGDDSDETEPDPEPEPAPEPSEPMDLTMPLTILIIAVSATILAGLGYVIYRLAHSARIKRAEKRRAHDELASRWTAAKELHQESVDIVASYELDVAKAIDYPAFNDVSVPEVSAMTSAMRRARDIGFQIDQNAEIGGSDDLLSTYRKAVDDFASAVSVAEKQARRIRWKSIPKDEQKLMKQAKNLLIQAEDPGNTDEARHTFYRQLKKTIDRLNELHGPRVVPAGTLGQIEEQTRLLIESPTINVPSENPAETAIRL